MFVLLNILWLIRTSKYVLFWLYLWQLKEYHFGRFLDHFGTEKGKKLVFSPVLLVKIVLVALFIFAQSQFSLWFSILFIIYILEAALFFKNIWQKSFKKPEKTVKTAFLGAVCFIAVILFLVFTALKIADVPFSPVWLLVFDILAPLTVSAVVLIFQPFFVMARNNILKKAGEKLKKFKNLKIIAITGSYGKTSTKEFLTTILSKKFRVISTKEHQNSEVGIAKCILNELNDGHQIFIVEVGAYNKGKVNEVCSMVKPKIGIVTGVNEQHMALFGTMDNLLSAEGGREMAKMLPENGLLVVNGDNKYCLDLYKRAEVKNKLIYATTKNIINADIWTEDIEAGEEFVSFVAVDKNKNMAHFKANVLGRHNVQNLLGAILVAKELGMTFEEIADACQDIKQEQAGMTLKKGTHGINVIDSSYSANPDGVVADLNYLSLFSGKRVVVMPCLIELGPKSSEIHEKIGRKIGEVCDMAIITTKERFEEIKKGAVESGMKSESVLLCDKPEDIFSTITLFCKSNDAVLLEGRVPQNVIKFLMEDIKKSTVKRE